MSQKNIFCFQNSHKAQEDGKVPISKQFLNFPWRHRSGKSSSSMLNFVSQILFECMHKVCAIRSVLDNGDLWACRGGWGLLISWAATLVRINEALSIDSPNNLSEHIAIIWSRFWCKLGPIQTINVWRVQIITWIWICCRMHGICESVSNKFSFVCFLFFRFNSMRNNHSSPSDLYAKLFWCTHRHDLVISWCLFHSYSEELARSRSHTIYVCQYQAVSVWWEGLW